MIGSISHELRTPLNSLIILLNSAKDVINLPPDFFEKYLKPAGLCSDYLLHLINDILDYTEINCHNDLRLVFEETNLHNVVQ